jgi:vacuolar protein sorting-associated protein 35
MTIYEDEISDSAAQRSALACIAGTLHQCVGFTTESRETLVHKTTAYSARLLKKPDQVRAVADCAHLFWGPEDAPGAARDAASVVTCLKKALKIAGGVQAAAVGGHAGGGDALALFIEVLNKYLYFFDAGCPSVDASVLQGLLEIINGELAGEEHGVTPDIQAYYGATVRHIKHQKLKGGEIGARYEAISL